MKRAQHAAVPPQDGLLKAAQVKDRDACRALFDAHYPAVMRYCLASTRGDRERAKDLVQETFASAFRSLHQVRHPERLRAWLLAIAANACRKAGAHQQRQRQLEAAVAIEEVAIDPEDERARAFRIEVVRAQIEMIEDPQLKEIVQLRYLEPEHSTKAIARRMGLPQGTVTVKLMRYRASIKAKLVRALLGGAR